MPEDWQLAALYAVLDCGPGLALKPSALTDEAEDPISNWESLFSGNKFLKNSNTADSLQTEINLNHTYFTG
jgi:hypothetical protein